MFWYLLCVACASAPEGPERAKRRVWREITSAPRDLRAN
jgi:hypothetical protein